MEDSSMLPNSSLVQSEAAVSFPRHRRRPLRSRTYLALIGILSRCHTNSPQLQIQEVDGDDSQSRQVSEENGRDPFNEVNSKAVLVSLPNSNCSEDPLVRESSNGEEKENNCGFGYNQAITPKLDHMNLSTDGEPEVAPANSISNGDSLMVENQSGDCAIVVDNEQAVANIVLDNQMDDLGAMEELIVDEEFSIADYSEVLDSCLGMDMVIEPSKRVDDNKENGTVLKENIFKETEHELHLKEKELEKLIFSSGAVHPLNCQNVDDEIEEGEISGDAGVAAASFDALNEDVASLGETSTEMVHAPEDYFNKEELTRNDDEERGYRQHQLSDPSVVDVVNNDRNSMKVGSRTTDGEMQDFHSQNVFHNSYMEFRRNSCIEPCSKKQSPPGSDFQENAAENQMAATFEKDGDAEGKKRKKGPMTKERKAKRKKKDRLKRAENNRQLGVKRLKLQPVLKPKTVSNCRHYMHGRCHEGEKCNFSHDTEPLTKSKPCGHFARQSCMKGDDCPFDHQLSKYPCKNYTANGFCSRGSDCLFSHQMPANQSLSMTPTASSKHSVPDKGGSSSKVSKPEGNFSSPLSKSNISKQTDNHGIFHQKVDARNTKQLAERTVPRTAGRAPNGVSFLSNDSIGCKTTLGVNKLNEKSEERVSPRKPQGINFLSFARPTSDESSSKILSRLLSNSNNITREPLMDNTSDGIPTCSLPASSDIIKVDTQMNQSATSLVSHLSEKVNGNLPQQSNFSLDKNHLDNPIINERANFHYKKGGSDLPSVNERQSALSGLSATLSTSFKTSFLTNTPSSVQKAIKSALAFAANLEPDIRVGSSLHQQGARNS